MQPLEDLKREAQRVITKGAERGITLRLLGGLAVSLHSPSASQQALSRPYPDLDFLSSEKRGALVEPLMVDLGYEPDRSFNLFNGDRRLLFFDHANDRQVDMFLGKFIMCHAVDVAERLTREAMTLPLAELLLTKLQIVQLNEKDVLDVCALIHDHPLGDTDDETLNVERIGELCGDDWGLWRTVTSNLVKADEVSRSFALDEGSRELIRRRLESLRQALESAPKTLRWKLRAKIGDRLSWYDLPEEVRRG